MKTLAPLRWVHRMILFAGISANSRLSSRVQTGPSVHLSKPAATRSATALEGTIWGQGTHPNLLDGIRGRVELAGFTPLFFLKIRDPPRFALVPCTTPGST